MRPATPLVARDAELLHERTETAEIGGRRSAPRVAIGYAEEATDAAPRGLIAPTHEARYYRCVDGTDGYSYLVQTGEFWRELDADHPRDAARLFRRH